MSCAINLRPLVLILPLCGSGWAQFAESGSIRENTEWLEKALPEASRSQNTSGILDEVHKLGEIEFKNCAIKFRSSVIRSRRDPPVVFGRQTRQAPPVQLSTIYVFDFGQMDAEAVSISKSHRKGMNQVKLFVTGGEKFVHFISDPNSSAERRGASSGVTITLKEKMTPQIVGAFQRLIKLCSAADTR